MYHMNVDVLKLAKKVEIALGILVENKIISRYRSVFRGKGLEFDGYRAYTSSDDAGLIDWKATIRSKQTLVKQFQEERRPAVVTGRSEFIAALSAGSGSSTPGTAELIKEDRKE